MKALLLALLLLPSVALATLFEDFVDFYSKELIFMEPPKLCKIDIKDVNEAPGLCFLVRFHSKGQRPFRIVHRDGVIEKLMTPVDAEYPTGQIDPESFMRASTI